MLEWLCSLIGRICSDDNGVDRDSGTKRVAPYQHHKLKVVASLVFRAEERVYVCISFHLSQI